MLETPQTSSPSKSSDKDTDMTVRATKFTPEVLLSAPRRSSAIPSPDGSLLLYTVSTYSFETHSKTSEIRIFDPRAGQSSNGTLYTNDSNASEPVWLGNGTLFFFLRSKEDGTTDLMVGDAGDTTIEPYVAGNIEGPVSNLKTTKIEDEGIAILVSGQATPEGKLFNPQKAKKPLSTGKVYTSLFVRHWDSYITPNRNSLFYYLLKNVARYPSDPARYEFANAALQNVLKDTSLESPVGPFGGTDNFDICPNGILFVAKDPKLNAATRTTTDPYFIPFRNDIKPHPRVIKVKGFEGASTSPVFSPDGKSAAFLRMKDSLYEADKNRIVVVPDIFDVSTAKEALTSDDGRGAWDLSPGSVMWSNDGKSLLLTADDEGKGALYSFSADPKAARTPPTLVWKKGSISDVRRYSNNSNKLLISSASLVDNSFWFVLDPAYPSITYNISSNSNSGRLFGLNPDQVSDFWFEGSEGHKVHALVMKPSNFDERNKYPLAYLIHGGPQGAWQDNWSTRWSPAVFAEQGYVVVLPNPTGSVGYGQDFTDRIQGQWGGHPYQDMVKGFEHVRDNLSYVDTDRSVCLGASYGGYATFWIQGQPLGRKFKALVTHDGVFSTLNHYSTDELWFPEHDFEGSLWDNRAAYERWDPSRFTGNWKTPHLVIHNELDYRLPVSEGLAAFNVLQARGVESKFLTFPDENHWVLKPENALHWHVEVLNWINHYVGLPPYKQAGDYEIQNGPSDEEMRQRS